ncbi:MAG: helix-turn-helix transcriptional regulator [Minicystis sp.]
MDDPRVAQMLQFIGANVYRLRRERGLTQEKLAEAADIELTFFQKIERAETNFGIALLVKLADALGVEAEALLKPAERPPVQRGRPRKKPAEG